MRITRRRKLLEKLIRLGRSMCRYCIERRLAVLTLEHLTPICRGGTWDLKNLDVTCYRCNLAKGKMTDREFKHHIKQIGGIARLPSFEAQTAAYVEGRAKQIRASSGRFRAFDTLAQAELERATR